MRAKGGEQRSLANYIGQLQRAGKLKTYFTEAGYVAYETKELTQYRKTSHIGRPPKVGVKYADGKATETN